MKAGAVIPSSKTCKCCNLLLPIAQFDKKPSNRDGFRHKCRSCAYPEKAVSNKRWVDLNRPKLNAYNAAWQRRKTLERIAARPKPPTCHCGNCVDFRWFGQAWLCIPCSKAQIRQRERARNRQKSIRNKSARLLKRYGPEMASAFDFLAAEGLWPIRHWQIVRRALPSHLRSIPDSAVYRIEAMNRLSKRPLWSVGWKCRCGIEHSDHRFFDLDHVIPKVRSGSNNISNLQILCPNCHRLKTISDLLERTTIQKQLAPPAQDHWQAGTVTTIDAGAESNTPPTASATSLSQL